MQRTKHTLRAILIFASLLSACSAQPTQIRPTGTAAQIIESEPSLVPTQALEPVITPSLVPLPRSEAEVPRVSIEETKAALESGTAVIVDVRSPGAYETSHIAGAISIPLGEIERNPTGLTLEKDQWIITYCT